MNIDEVKIGDRLKVVGTDSFFVGQIVEVTEIDKSYGIILCMDKDGDPVGFNPEHLEMYDDRHLCKCDRIQLFNRGCLCGGR